MDDFAGGALEVKFFMRPVKDAKASLEEGRAVYRNVEHVEIRVAGDRSTEVVRAATNQDREQYARSYIAFKNIQEKVEDGLPLTHWPVVDSAQVLELRDLGIVTVESLAKHKDHKYRFVGELAEKADKYIKLAKDGAGLLKAAEELEAAQAEIRKLTEKVRKLEAAAKVVKDNE